MTPTPLTFNKMIEDAPDGVVLVNASGVIVYVNSRITDLFGYLPSDLIGNSIEVLMPKRFHVHHVNHRSAYTQNPRLRPMGDTQLLFLGQHLNGTEFPVEIHLAPLSDQGQDCTLAFIRDATDRHEILRELKERTQAAREAEKVKGEFLAQAAHDMSQPIQTLELLINSIERHVPLPSQLVELAGVASISLARMRELLKMLLEISRIESGTIQISEHPVQVADICKDLERQFESSARAKALKFHSFPCSRIVETDPTLLRGMLSNLITNAIRYTQEGEVSVECLPTVDGGVRFAIHDTGIGIPEEQRGAIFDDFYRGTSAERMSQDGFGLGLGIVRRLSKLLAFPVTVDSEIGYGSTFAVHIPGEKVFLIPDSAPSR